LLQIETKQKLTQCGRKASVYTWYTIQITNKLTEVKQAQLHHKFAFSINKHHMGVYLFKFCIALVIPGKKAYVHGNSRARKKSSTNFPS
jgi:hypothetical protein